MKRNRHVNVYRQGQAGRHRVLPFILAFALLFLVASPSAEAATTQTLDARFPGLSNGLLKSAVLSDLPEGVILESGAVVIKSSDLASKLNQYDLEIRNQLKQNMFFLLEQEATGVILASEAEAAGGGAQGETEKKLIERHLAGIAGNAKVTDEDVKVFYEGNREMLGGAAFEQVKEPIRELLLKQKQGDLVLEYIQSLGQNREIKVDLGWVREQYKTALENPADQARRSGKPTMIEFGATGCIPCDRMQPVLESLRKKFGSKLNVVFVHVRQEQVLGARYGIRSIPVQVFFNADGNEVFRHEGFFPEEKILPVLKDMGLG